MKDLEPEQLLCQRAFLSAEVFPSKDCSKDFSILEASGRADLFTLLNEEFPHARVEQLKEQKIGGCPRTRKKSRMWNSGEHKVRPYKGFPGSRRGEPCVHPTFSDSLLDEQNGETFDYIAAAGFKYIPYDRTGDSLFPQLLALLKPGGVIAAAVCGFSGYYGLVMLGSIVETLSRDKEIREGVRIAEAVLNELPSTHPVFETGNEVFLQRLKSRDETAFKDLMTLAGSIGHIDRLFSVSKLMESIPRWGGRFIRWVFPNAYDPPSHLGRLTDLPEPRRSITAELVAASPPEHYFLFGRGA